MAYATLVDVQQRMPQFVLTATTKPSLADAQVFLDDIDAEVESALLNMGYQLPITGTKALKQVRAIVCQGTIAQILFARAGAVGTEAAVQSAHRAQDMHDDALKALHNPRDPRELTDAARTGDEIVKPGGELRAFSPDEDDVNQTARATVGKVF